MRILLCAAAFTMVAVVGCIRNPATREMHARLLSPEAEKRIGQETKRQILEQYTVLESTPVAAYVNEIGQSLATVSDRPTIDYEFTVLDHDLINAFAAPGGYIFVTRGLLEHIDDEDELAMVLGHEIAHVAALHGVQMIQKEMGQNALTILGTIGAALVAGPEAMIMVSQTGNLFSSLYLLGYSREKELEADNLGLQYMLRAEYDPTAALSFLKELGKGDTDVVAGWDLYFRTHPTTTERIDIIEHMIGRPRSERAASKDRYQKIKSLLPRVDEEERGVVAGHRYRNAVHELALSIPENWRFSREHPQSLITFATKDGDGGGRLQTVTLSTTTKAADEMVLRFAKESGFKQLTGRDVLYQAGYGYLGRFLGISPRGQLMEYRIFGTIRRGHGYLILAGAPPEKANSYALDLERIMRSLNFG